jgi:hypothetical protein
VREREIDRWIDRWMDAQIDRWGERERECVQTSSGFANANHQTSSYAYL